MNSGFSVCHSMQSVVSNFSRNQHTGYFWYCKWIYDFLVTSVEKKLIDLLEFGVVSNQLYGLTNTDNVIIAICIVHVIMPLVSIKWSITY